MEELPETILQFGGGGFLRAFADVFVHEANAGGEAVGRVVVVQSTAGNRAALLNAQGGRYHVVVRGLADGVEIDNTLAVRSISRALPANSEWTRVIEVARTPALRMVISNTTEAGYALADNDDPDLPRSFPARLLCILKARHEAGLPGLAVLPCELVEPNGELLRDLVLSQADAWHLEEELKDWIRRDVRWCEHAGGSNRQRQAGSASAPGIRRVADGGGAVCAMGGRGGIGRSLSASQCPLRPRRATVCIAEGAHPERSAYGAGVQGAAGGVADGPGGGRESGGPGDG